MNEKLSLMIVFRVTVILLIAISLSGCKQSMRVMGFQEGSKDELFVGNVTSDVLTGDSQIFVKSNINNKSCQGKGGITYAPALECKGQRGVANLLCTDNTTLKARYTVQTCSSGYGEGKDSTGRKFYFWFAKNLNINQIKKNQIAYFKKEWSNPEIDKIEKESSLYGAGTGFFITKKGHIITSWHVIKSSKSIFVILKDGTKSIAKVIDKDIENDIALIKVDGNDKFIYTPIPITSTRDVKPGNEVFTIGYPKPDIQGINKKSTFGRINSLSGILDDPRFLQIDVEVQPGNSGGPLIDKNGKVVGIITSMLQGKNVQNVNYALKSDYILPMVFRLQPQDKSNNSISKFLLPISNIFSEKDVLDFSDYIEKYDNSIVLIVVSK